MRTLTYWSICETGKRSGQEDSIHPVQGGDAADCRTFIVCDGMGGHAHGEVASSAVCAAISGYFREHPDGDVRQALDEAYDSLDSYGLEEDGKVMGTTLAMIHFTEEEALMVHIGDSRIYHIRPSERRIVSVSKDHSLVNELLDSGELTPEEAVSFRQKNVITRCMQPGRAARDYGEVRRTSDVAEGDVFYVCSDGMLETMTDREIVNVLSMDVSGDKMIKMIKTLTDDARDNHSCLLIRVGKDANKAFRTRIGWFRGK